MASAEYNYNICGRSIYALRQVSEKGAQLTENIFEAMNKTQKLHRTIRLNKARYRDDYEI